MWNYPAFAAVLIALATSPPAGADECVVLLHGLWRTENSMGRMEKSLGEAGYRVLNIEYESTEKPIELLADEAVRKGVEGCGDADSMHFVTHSMGGILLRQYLEQHEIPRLGRGAMQSSATPGWWSLAHRALWRDRPVWLVAQRPCVSRLRLGLSEGPASEIL